MQENTDKSAKQRTTLIIFQQNNCGSEKIKGLTKYGVNLSIKKIFTIEAVLPEIVDDPQHYIPDDFNCDIVLSFLNHPDLLDYLIRICSDKNIPVIASGKKSAGAITPFTCCGLGPQKGLGSYGLRFGFPVMELRLNKEGSISDVEIIRGASCGATWEAVPKILGLPLEEALVTYAREIQYLCKADPSAFDPITGKSALHYAGHVHCAALKKAAAQTKK